MATEKFKTKEELHEWLELNIPRFVSPERLQEWQHIKAFKTEKTREKILKIMTDKLWEKLNEL